MHTTYTSPKPPNFSHLAIIITNETHLITPYPCASARAHTHSRVHCKWTTTPCVPWSHMSSSIRNNADSKTAENNAKKKHTKNKTLSSKVDEREQRRKRQLTYCRRAILRCDAKRLSVRLSVCESDSSSKLEEEIWPPPALQNRRRVEASSPALQLPRCSLRVPTSAIATKLLQLLSPPGSTHHLLNQLTIYYLSVTVLRVTRVTVTHMLFIYPDESVILYLLRPCPRGVLLLVYHPNYCI